jgi:hypothetical protein
VVLAIVLPAAAMGSLVSSGLATAPASAATAATRSSVPSATVQGPIADAEVLDKVAAQSNVGG